MGRHNKPSRIQSWLSYIVIFSFALLLSTFGTVLKIQGGGIPGIIEPRPASPAFPQAMPPVTTTRIPSNTVTANRPELNSFVIPSTTTATTIPPITTTTVPSTRPPTTSKPTPSKSELGAFSALAECESSGDWDINTGNGYYGGLQISLKTWIAYGGLKFAARPDLASKDEQLIIAGNIKAGQGFEAWPACSAKIGLL